MKLRFQFSPEPDWGPGDRKFRDDYLALQYQKAFRCKQHPYGYPANAAAHGGYDNYGYGYGYYGYATAHPAGSYHM